MEAKRRWKCDWCKSEENQKKLGEEVFGFIILCQTPECGHEYLVPEATQAGKDFFDAIPDMIEEIENEKKGK